VDIVYLDFLKSYGKVSHDYLIQKLHSLGMHDKILYWIRDFLNDHSQFVSYSEYISTSVKVGSGVRQGSVVVPASFVTFINDIPDAVSLRVYVC